MTPRSLEHVETAGKIQSQDLVEIGAGVVQQPLANIDRRCSDYGVYLPVLLFDGAEGLGDRGRVGNIQCKRFRLAPMGANPGGGLLRAGTIDVGADGEGAHCGESFRGREADAGSRARYEGDTAIQPE